MIDTEESDGKGGKKRIRGTASQFLDEISYKVPLTGKFIKV